MGILSYLGLERKSAAPITNTAELLRSFNDKSAGQEVNWQTALQVATVLCCARVIAEGMAQVPCKVYRDDAFGSPVEAKDHPLYLLLNRKPNDWQTSFELREQIGLHLVLTNNAYIYKNMLGNTVLELYALDPNAVEVKRDKSDLTLSYQVTFEDGKIRTIPASDMWHIRGPSWNGYCGLDAVKTAAKTIGLAIATEQFGTKLFENGARPGGMLTPRSGAQTLTKEQRDELKALWAANYQGSINAHKTVMLPFDMEFTAVHSTANEAQWIESRKFLIEEICRFFRVQPIMVMQSGATSYNSVEQLFLNHLMHTLMPWFERFEQSAEVSLLTDKELRAGYSIKLSANALLRASHGERAKYYQTMRSIGAMTANEVRAKEDMPRSPDPTADTLAPAANIFGGANQAPNPTSPENNDNEVSE